VIERTHRRVVVGLVPAIIALAGCGHSSNAPRSQTASKPPGTSHLGQSGHGRPSRSQSAVDRALGDRALLRLTDFPTGWTASARRKTPSQPKLDQEVAACLHVAPSLVNERDPAEVRSPDFKHTGGGEISNTVTVTPTPDVAANQFSVFTKPETARCLRDGIEQEIRYTLSHPKAGSRTVNGVSFGHATVEQMSFPSIGDQSIAYRVGLSVSAKTLHFPLYFDVVLVRAGRAELSLNFSGLLVPTSPSTEIALTDLTVRRLDAALGTRTHTAPEVPSGAHEGPV
jgi:hypothetical protein